MNGKWRSTSLDVSGLVVDKLRPLYLYISGQSCGGQVRVNLGNEPFKYVQDPPIVHLVESTDSGFHPVQRAL
eukprot:124892-Prymnesium_polylepis.2